MGVKSHVLDPDGDLVDYLHAVDRAPSSDLGMLSHDP
jgi:hypothetical protein